MAYLAGSDGIPRGRGLGQRPGPRALRAGCRQDQTDSGQGLLAPGVPLPLGPVPAGASFLITSRVAGRVSVDASVSR